MGRAQFILALVLAASVNLTLMAATVLLAGAPGTRLLTIPVGAFLLLSTIWIVAESWAQNRFRPRLHLNRRRPDILAPVTALTVLLIGLIALIEFATRGRVALFPVITGAFLMVGGIALRVAAIRDLGELFCDHIEVLPGHTLVTNGVYGLLRHPSELGTLLIGAGTALCLNSLSGFAIWTVLLAPLVCVRVAREDTLLRGCFGQDFLDYAYRVNALIPFSTPLLTR